MSLITSAKLKKALNFEGFLEKQSPSFPYKYQKRYFKIIDEGRSLVYADDKKTLESNVEKLKGQIPIKDITSIIHQEKPLKFQIMLQERVYKLLAENKEIKEEWVEVLQICQEYAKEMDRKEKEVLTNLGSEFKVEKSENLSNSQQGSSFIGSVGGFLGFPKKEEPEKNRSRSEIQPETEKPKFIFENVKVEIGPSRMNMDQNLPPNEEYLAIKGYNSELDRIDPKLLKSRIIMGLLTKESKEASGNALVDGVINKTGIREKNKKRWCLMISSKPIIPELADPDDEETIDSGKFPLEIEPDVFYYFESECNNSKPLGSIPMKNVGGLIMKEKIQGENIYRFTVDTGEKKFNFTTLSVLDRGRWLTALSTSLATVKELGKSKLNTLKNINKIIRIYDDKTEQTIGYDKLCQKIEEDYKKLTNGQDNNYPDIETLLGLQKKAAGEYIGVINACLAHKDLRIDIIKVYAENLHEKICNALKNYIKTNTDKLQNGDMFEIINFLQWYRESLKIFGEAFIDIRINDAIQTLCLVIAKRITKTNLNVIQNILKTEVESEPKMNQTTGKLHTDGPSDLFKLLNEIFNTLHMCDSHDLAIELLGSCKNSIEFYQDGLDKLTANMSLSLEHYSAFCNNVISALSLTKTFCDNARVITNLDEAHMDIYFDESDVKRKFADIGRLCYEKIVNANFKIMEDQIQKPFLEMNLETLLTKIFQNLSDYIDLIHPNYKSKIWMGCVERTVLLYCRGLLLSADKKLFKKLDLSNIRGKLARDQEIIKEMYGDVIKESAMTKQLKNILYFEDFLKAGYQYIPSGCKELKEIYGNSLKWKNVKLLIELRDDIPSDQINDIMKKSQEIIEAKISEENSNEEKKSNLFRKLTLNEARFKEMEFGGDQKTISNNDSMVLKTSLSSSNEVKKKIKLNLSNYLEYQESGSFSIGYNTRYFTINKGNIYIYKNRESERAEDCLKIHTFNTCTKISNLEFFVKTKDDKQLKFRTSIPEDCEEWIDAINELIKLDDKAPIIEIKEMFYKDPTPLFGDFEKDPDLQFDYFSYTKHMQQIDERKKTIAIEAQKEKEAALQQQNQIKRRKSFDITEDARKFSILINNEPTQRSCSYKFCKIFGIRENDRKNRADYTKL